MAEEARPFWRVTMKGILFGAEFVVGAALGLLAIGILIWLVRAAFNSVMEKRHDLVALVNAVGRILVIAWIIASVICYFLYYRH
jgi:hypothetical protein